MYHLIVSATADIVGTCVQALYRYAEEMGGGAVCTLP